MFGLPLAGQGDANRSPLETQQQTIVTQVNSMLEKLGLPAKEPLKAAARTGYELGKARALAIDHTRRGSNDVTPSGGSQNRLLRSRSINELDSAAKQPILTRRADAKGDTKGGGGRVPIGNDSLELRT